MTTMLVPMIAATLELDASTPRKTATTIMHALEIGAILKLDAVILPSIVTITMLAPLTDVHEPEDAYTSRQFAMITTPALAISAILQVDVNSFPSNCQYYQMMCATLFPAIIEGELSQPQLFATTTTHALSILAIKLEDAYSLMSTSMTTMLAQETGATEQQEPSTTTESFAMTTTHAQQTLAMLSSVASTSMLVL
jgi:hypothetical protein